jgi:hypothetical protein
VQARQRPYLSFILALDAYQDTDPVAASCRRLLQHPDIVAQIVNLAVDMDGENDIERAPVHTSAEKCHCVTEWKTGSTQETERAD